MATPPCLACAMRFPLLIMFVDISGTYTHAARCTWSDVSADNAPLFDCRVRLDSSFSPCLSTPEAQRYPQPIQSIPPIPCTTYIHTEWRECWQLPPFWVATFDALPLACHVRRHQQHIQTHVYSTCNYTHRVYRVQLYLLKACHVEIISTGRHTYSACAMVVNISTGIVTYSTCTPSGASADNSTSFRSPRSMGFPLDAMFDTSNTYV